jgi:hypothetical protein
MNLRRTNSERVASFAMDVWVLARPLTLAVGFTKMMSEGKTTVCHLALLVTKLNFGEVKRILNERRNEDTSATDQEMGDLWELYRDEHNKNHACLTRGFRASSLNQEWRLCCGTRAGRTTMTIIDIKREGISSSPLELI